MKDSTKANLIKWASILVAYFIVGTLCIVVLCNATQTSTIIITAIIFCLSLGAFGFLGFDAYLEDVILRRFFNKGNLYKKTTEQMSDAERILELEKSVGRLQKKLCSAKILAVCAILFSLAICMYLFCFRS